MRRLLTVLCFLLAFLAVPTFASSTPPSAAQVKLELLKQLEADGYLSTKLTAEAKDRYVKPEDLTQATLGTARAGDAAAEPTLWERYVSWSSFFKLVGVIFLLVAFSGYIARLAAGLWFIIAAVPKELYQGVFLAGGTLLTIAPQLVWASQAFYLAVFGAFASLMVLAWTIDSHPKLQEALRRIFSLGVPPMTVASFWAMLYFGALALHHQSQLFGFFAAVALSGVFTFGLYYRPGVLTLHFNEKALGAVVWGHLVVLSLYAGLRITGALPPEGALFTVGLEYYCTIAMGVGFLVAASPFTRTPAALGYLLLFVLVTALSVIGYFFFDLKVICSILLVIAVLLALEWIGRMSYHAGFLFGTLVMGAVLYGGSLLLEQYGHFIVLRLA